LSHISSDDNEVIDDIEIVPYCSHKLRECSLYEINFNITAVFKIAKAFIHSTPSFTSIDISKISVCSAIGSSVIGISVNDVMDPGRKVTFLKLESKSIPFPVISIYNICWQNI